MLKLGKIAITGGVASGKTSVCKFFRELGAYVVNADAIVHELLKPNTALGQQIIRTLGPEIHHDGKIDRKIVAEKVFHHPEKLTLLERLLHPAVLQRIEELYKEAAQAKKYTSFVVEIPLLYEIGGEPFYDAVIAVVADEPIARRRFEQTGFQKDDYERRMNRQLSPEQKTKRADYTLSNNGSLEDLKTKVIELNRILHIT